MATILTTNQNCVEGSLPVEVTWQQALKRSIRSGRELCRLLEISEQHAETRSEDDFPVFVPLEFASRMKRGDRNDPLLLQVLGTATELQSEGVVDPVGDLPSLKCSGLLQKYSGRVLLIANGACAVHCRYCFRRHFPYSTDQNASEKWAHWLDWIRKHEDIEEVILSGGDPLCTTDELLSRFVSELNTITHVKRLRVHTRFPVIIPQRISADLLTWIRASRPAVYMVLHVNHPQEIDSAILERTRLLQSAGAVLMNQAVLLAGINDSANCQIELCQRLADHQILPYYLHQLDPVQGATHFKVSDERALDILSTMRASLPGYAVPQLVRELAGQPNKTPVEAQPGLRTIAPVD